MDATFRGLGDARLDRVMQFLVERASDRCSLILRRISAKRSQEVSFGRFLRNSFVSLQRMTDVAVRKTGQQVSGRHVLLVQDTSEMSFGYKPFQTGLGPVGNGVESGFFAHPVLAMDADDNLCLGLAGLEVFKRPEASDTHRNQRAFKDKMSYRWLSSVQAAQANCLAAARLTVVSDREGDIFEALEGYFEAKLDFVVRCQHDRPLAQSDGDATQKLWQTVNAWPVAGTYELDLPRTDARSAHKARLLVRFGSARLARPEHRRSDAAPDHLAVYVLDVREHADTVVNKEAPIHWRLLTSHTVDTLQIALQIIHWYSMRWNIEQVFRILKSQGLNLQNSLVETYEGLAKLALIGLLAAVRVLQLVGARDKPHIAAADVAFDPEQIELLEKINSTLEGRTSVQQNPYPKQSLAFAAWVIARLGGWKSASKIERPPGPITMLLGLQRFHDYCHINALLQKTDDDT